MHNEHNLDLPQLDLEQLGAGKIVYVKPVMSEDAKKDHLEGIEDIPDGIQLYVVHSADGLPMAVLDDRDMAFIGARQYGMEALSVH